MKAYRDWVMKLTKSQGDDLSVHLFALFVLIEIDNFVAKLLKVKGF